MLGPPGSGKGTHARKLHAKYGFTVVGTGEILRNEIKKGTKSGKEIEDLMKTGKLFPDELMGKIVSKKIESTRNGKGFVFDGYPRTTSQADFLDQFLSKKKMEINIVFDILVPEKVAVDRISGRWNCPKCGFIYHVKYIPPKTLGICDKCGAGLTQRADEKPDIVKKRFKEYHKLTEPLRDYYKENDVLWEVDGTGTPEEVFNEIIRIIDSMQKEKQ
ncbi:adenylate kinase [Candidatus Woesearchaeota archaeon]|nr:adenylate kinase [Candidatus Woesearchaeota archaeon]